MLSAMVCLSGFQTIGITVLGPKESFGNPASSSTSLIKAAPVSLEVVSLMYLKSLKLALLDKFAYPDFTSSER